MHPFDDLDQVQSVIDRLPELIMKLERRPGEKESRFAHLLSGPPAISHIRRRAAAAPAARPNNALEDEVAQLRQELEDLETTIRRVSENSLNEDAGGGGRKTSILPPSHQQPPTSNYAARNGGRTGSTLSSARQLRTPFTGPCR